MKRKTELVQGFETRSTEGGGVGCWDARGLGTLHDLRELLQCLGSNMQAAVEKQKVAEDIRKARQHEVLQWRRKVFRSFEDQRRWGCSERHSHGSSTTQATGQEIGETLTWEQHNSSNGPRNCFSSYALKSGSIRSGGGEGLNITALSRWN